MMQWQCITCGAWVSMDRAKHLHPVTPDSFQLKDMIRAREAGIDPTDVAYREERWTPKHTTRKAPPDA